MRYVRYFLWIFALGALCAMGYILSLYLLIDANSAKTHIVQALKQDLGYHIEFSSELKVRVLPNVHIEMPAAQITRADQTPLASFRSGSLTLNPLWFIIGTTHIQELSINGFITSLQVDQSPSQWLNAAKTEKLSLIEDTVIEHLVLNDAEVTFIQDDQNLTLRNLSLKLSEPSPQMHGPMSFNAQMQVMPSNLLVDFQSQGDLDVDLHTGQLGFERFKVHALATHEAQSFEFTAFTPLATIQADQLYANSASIDAHSSAYQHSAQINVADFVLNPQGWQAPDFNIIVNASYINQPIRIDVRSPSQYTFADQQWKAEHIQGQIQLPDQQQPSALSGSLLVNLEQQSADFSFFGRLFDAPSNIQGSLQSFNHPKIQAKITLGRLDLSAFSTDSIVQSLNTIDAIKHDGLSLNEATQEARQSVSLSSLEEQETQLIDFSWLNRFDFSGEVQVGELSFHQAKIVQLKAPLQLNNGLLNVPKASALFYDGPLSAQASLSHQGFWNARIRTSDVQLDGLFSDLNQPHKTGAVAQIQTDLYGEEPRLDSVHGQFGFYLTRGKLLGINLENALERVKHHQQPAYDPKFVTEFNDIQGLARIKDAKASFTRFTASTKSGMLKANPSIDLNSQQVNGVVSGQASGLKVLGELSGPWYNPSLTLDYNSMLELNHLTEQQKSSGWDKFKNFLKQRL